MLFWRKPITNLLGHQFWKIPKYNPPKYSPSLHWLAWESKLQTNELHVRGNGEDWKCYFELFFCFLGFDIIHSFETATAHEGYLGKNWLDAFKSLLATSLQELHKDSDKDSVAALNTLGYSLQHSHTLDFETLSLLSTCSVDQVSLIHGFVCVCV